MVLSENMFIICFSTNMSDAAREALDFEKFNNQWCAKMLLLSISNKEEDKQIYEAMKKIESFDFYNFANKQ